MAKRPVSTDRLGEFFAEMPAFLEPHADRLYQWVVVTEHVTTKLADRRRTKIVEEVFVFVVRIAGVLTDLRTRFSGPTPADILAHGGEHAQWREGVRMRVVNAIAAAYAQLTEDELLWLELRRHEQSHPFLDGYRPKATDGENWDKWRSKILDGKVLPIAEVLRRCDALEKAHGPYPRITESIAIKVLPHVVELACAMSRLTSGLTWLRPDRHDEP